MDISNMDANEIKDVETTIGVGMTMINSVLDRMIGYIDETFDVVNKYIKYYDNIHKSYVFMLVKSKYVDKQVNNSFDGINYIVILTGKTITVTTSDVSVTNEDEIKINVATDMDKLSIMDEASFLEDLMVTASKQIGNMVKFIQEN